MKFLINLIKGKQEESSEKTPPSPPANVIDLQTYKASAEVVNCRYLTREEKKRILANDLTAEQMLGNVVEAIKRGIEHG